MQFGTYLVRHGVVTPEQFVEAAARQSRAQLPLGRLALDARKLSMKQVFKILSVQAETQQRFGEIAVEEGYLTEEGIGALVWEQQATLKPFGEIFVEMSALSEADCRHHLAAFHRAAFQECASSDHELSQTADGSATRESAPSIRQPTEVSLPV